MTGTRGVFISAVLVLAVGCGERSVVPDVPVWSVEAAEVVFTARREGNTDLYVVGADGSGGRRLTTDAAPDNFARVSPDGRRIAFQSRRTGATSDLFVMDVDGGSVRQLTADPAWEVLPSWSPDGTRIAFMSTRGFTLGDEGPFPGHLYVADADGARAGDAGAARVTTTLLTSSLGPHDWTVDGRGLLSSRVFDDQIDLVLVDVGTGEETRLTTAPENEYGADISPDGTQIALHVETDDGSQIAVMNSDGAGRRLLTSGPTRRYGPRWSPDGAWLVFSAQGAQVDGAEQYDIHIVRVADGEERVVIATPDDEREADWLRAPSSLMIAGGSPP